MKPYPIIPIFSGFAIDSFLTEASQHSSEIAATSRPTVRVTHTDHPAKNLVPRVLFGHDRIGEHATIPADMLDSARGSILEPRARVLDNIELPVGIIDTAMLTGCVMRPTAVDGAVALADMNIHGPWPQSIADRLPSLIELIATELAFQKTILASRIVTEQEGQDM